MKKTPIKNSLVLLPLILLVGWSCQQEQPTTAEETAPASSSQLVSNTLGEVQLTEAALKMAEISIGTPQLQQVSQSINVRGLLDVPPNSYHDLHFPTEVYVKKFNLVPGEQVQRGQVVATLEHPSFITLQADYLQAKSQLQYLEKEYARQEILAAGEATALKNWEMTQAEFAKAKAQKASLAAQLELMGFDPEQVQAERISTTALLRSPVNGMIAEVNMRSGMLFKPEKKLLTVVDHAQLHAELEVYQEDISRITIGQEVDLAISGYSKGQVVGTVQYINPVMSLQEKTVQVHVEVPNDEGLTLKPGMFVEASIAENTRAMITVPELALARSGNAFYVFEALGDGKFQQHLVKINARHGDKVSIGTTAITEQTKIVTEGANYLQAALESDG